MSKIKHIEMVDGSTEMNKQVPLQPQVVDAPDAVEVADDNDSILQDAAKYLKSHAVKVEKAVGRGSMLDPNFQIRGIDYRVGGLLDVRWVRNTDANISKAKANKWVFPETISPRLKNQTLNELVLMVRLQEQSNNQVKYFESEAQNYERKEFYKMQGGTPDGFSEFSVTRPTQRAT